MQSDSLVSFKNLNQPSIHFNYEDSLKSVSNIEKNKYGSTSNENKHSVINMHATPFDDFTMKPSHARHFTLKLPNSSVEPPKHDLIENVKHSILFDKNKTNSFISPMIFDLVRDQS